MWIWISVMGWLCCGVAAYLMMRNAFLGRSEWGGFEKVAAFVMSLSGPFLFIVVLIAEGKDCFRRRKKMEKIYWNERAGQIMTKGGQCLYDVGAIDRSLSILHDAARVHSERLGRIDELLANATDASKIYQQLACAHKGHKIVYARKDLSLLAPYVFGCSNCGLGITKTKKELTPSEREALKKLKVI